MRELAGLLEVRRQRLRRPARDRGSRGVHARVDLPRALDLRLEPPLATRPSGDDLDRGARRLALGVRFILVANSWMQHPVGYKIVDGEAHLTSVWGAPLQQLRAPGAPPHHARRAHLRVDRDARHLLLALPPRPRSRALPPRCEAGLIVAVPVTLLQLVVGNRFGEAVTSAQSMKIAASEAQWKHVPAVRLLGVPDRWFHRERRDRHSRSRSASPLVHGDRPVQRAGQGLNQLQAQEQSKYGSGNYIPNVRVIYWSMRVMAFTGVLDVHDRRGRGVAVPEEEARDARWFQWTAMVAIAFPYIAATAGWVLTEMGRQPWIVQGC